MRNIRHNDVFEFHEIKHLSASSLNKFRAEPALWVWSYLFKNKRDAGPKAWRGEAVEAGLRVALYGGSEVDALNKTKEVFAHKADGDISGLAGEQYDALEEYLRHSIDGVRSIVKATPNASQKKVEAWVDGISVPVIGYTDFEWPDLVLDLKTTDRVPSQLSGDHARQATVYQKATGKPVSFIYASKKKSSVLTLLEEDAAKHWTAIKADALALQAMLSIGDKENILKTLPVFSRYNDAAENDIINYLMSEAA